MLPTMYSSYITKQPNRRLPPNQRVQMLGAEPAGATTIINGVQKLTKNANAQIAGYLGALYFGAPIPTPAEGATVMQALPCDQAKQSAGQSACQATAYATLGSRPPGSTVLVDFAGASPTGATVTIVRGTEGVSQEELLRQMAGEGSNLAVFEPAANGKTDKEKKDEEKDEEKGTTLLVGAGAGGAAGFFTFGVPGALVGAAGGALLANWLAA